MEDELFGFNDYDNEDGYLEHYGTKYHSGRYPYGSGEDPFQHDPKGFYAEYRKLKAEGMSQGDMCIRFGMSSTQLRARVSACKEQEMLERNNLILKYKAHGESNTAIAAKMGINESTVRSAIAQAEKGQVGRVQETADMLKQQVESKGVIDVGAGVNLDIGVTETKLNTAVQMLQDQGYEVYNIKVEQATNSGNFTTVKVLAAPGTEWADIYYNLDKIKTVDTYSNNGGDSFKPLVAPESIDSSRVFVRYAEDGGLERDGTIELRPGVNDISLGNSSYAQVRIGVDGKYYAKGMAFYNNNIPEGYDIVVNSNKPAGTDISKVLKPMKDDPDNPFGALIKAQGQTWYTDENGVEHVSVCNKLKEQEDWESYSKNLASQFLAKQDPELINRQLDLTLQGKRNELEDIRKCSNVAIKQELLNTFADDCESSAVHLKAAPLPGQSTKVLLPINSLKDNECYCPALPNGQEVCLVRYPHGGTFEIPRLTNNVTNSEGKSLIGNKALDVIGINANAASILSGADFDGDTAIVIPIKGNTKIVTSTLDSLKGFDPKERYPYQEGQRKCWAKGSQEEQTQMGMISNLITDMTIQGAKPEELARAVKHSMVVIDTGKHKLNYHQSEIDNEIQSLKDKYQNPTTKWDIQKGDWVEVNKKSGGGASTLLSRASGDVRIPEVKYDKVNKETGVKEHVYTNRTFQKNIKEVDDEGNVTWKKGKVEAATSSSKKMLEVDDAFKLSSGSKVETYYANYANALKSMALTARKEALSLKSPAPSETAKRAYDNEIKSLNSKLNTALKNAPRERAAQIKAAAAVQTFKKENKSYIKDDRDKLANKTLNDYRVKYGAKMSGEKGRSIKLTQKEWDAINANALSGAKVKQILRYSSDEEIRKFAMPKESNKISAGKESMMKAMANNGYSLAEIADQLGVSASTVSKYVNAAE